MLIFLTGWSRYGSIVANTEGLVAQRATHGSEFWTCRMALKNRFNLRVHCVCPWNVKAFTALFTMLFISVVGLRGSASQPACNLYWKPAVGLSCHVLLITCSTGRDVLGCCHALVLMLDDQPLILSFFPCPSGHFNAHKTSNWMGGKVRNMLQRTHRHFSSSMCLRPVAPVSVRGSFGVLDHTD